MTNLHGVMVAITTPGLLVLAIHFAKRKTDGAITIEL